MKSIDTIRLRMMLGWLGLLLPWIVLALCVIFDCVPGPHIFPHSISATYHYAPTITPFMIILGSSGLLLMCYRGYTKVDDIINTITGFFGLCICLFPTWGSDLVYNGTFQVPNDISSAIHNISAIGFFGLLSFNCLFLFTKSSGTKTKKKKIRNAIYIICGIGMIVSMTMLLVFSGVWAGIWAAEAAALMFFGIAFLTKADIYPWLFCDSAKKDEDTDNA